jgi:uncharacterized glyoxalase superfamily protein PhnB
MDAQNIPNGLHYITPYFTVERADLLLDFVLKAFDGVVIKVDRYKAGHVQHARIKIGNSIIMLNEAVEGYAAQISQMHLFVDNVDDRYKRALDLGATSIMRPNKRPHGDWMAGIKDPCGNIWWIATPDHKSS